MYVIGISSGIKHGHHDGAAALLKDGQLIAAAEEERFTLSKHARGELPRGAIDFCLKQAGISIKDVDWICSPLKTYTNYERRLTEYFKFQFGHSPKIQLYDHHLCHAASSYYGSGFSEATVICFDFSGNSSSGMVAHAKGNDFRELTRFGRRNSLGLYYGMLTQYLGYQMTNDEYKVMGLSSYGTPRYLEEFAKVLRPAGMSYELDEQLDKRQQDAEIFTSDFSTRQERIFTAKLEDLLGPRRVRGQPLDQRFTDIAASGQKQLELVADLRRPDGDRSDRLSGRLPCRRRRAELQDEHGDRSRTFGRQTLCASRASRRRCGAGCSDAEMRRGRPQDRAPHPCVLGAGISNDVIRDTLEKVGARYEVHDDPAARCVTDLTEQKTVGWFQGRMEYGPRALGNRRSSRIRARRT